MSSNAWAFARRVGIPLGVLFVLLAILTDYIKLSPSAASAVDLSSYYTYFQNLLPKIFVLLVLFLIFKILIYIAEKILVRFTDLFSDEQRTKALVKILRFLWWIIYTIVALSLLFGQLGSLITSLGLIGLGLTFALQKPILNMVGWLTILTKGIYSEGDRVRIGNVRGDVKEIQLMNTVVYSLLENSNVRSHKLVSVPNDMILNTDVENYTKEGNYIMDELTISITYESNYRKAMAILNDIIIEHLKSNIRNYVKARQESTSRIDQFLSSWRNRKPNELSDAKPRAKRDAPEAKVNEELEEEFKPKVRLEMADSALLLSAQFVTPYNQVKKNRTFINLAFLDAIAKEKDIEVAYPHMELVYHGDSGSKPAKGKATV